MEYLTDPDPADAVLADDDYVVAPAAPALLTSLLF